MGRASHDRHGNWIANQWGGARSGATFRVETSLLEAPEEHRTWPRSGSAELAAALDAARGARESWRALGSKERFEFGLELARRLEDSLHLELATLLDLEDLDLAEHVSQLTRRLADLDPSEAEARFSGGNLVLARSDWRHLFGGFETALTALLAGAPLLLLADPRVPQLARAIARAAEESDLPAGALSLLCDDGWTVLRGAIVSGEVTHVSASGPRKTLNELKGIALRAPARQERAGFGAGIAGADRGEAAGGLQLALEETRSCTTVVRVERGLEAEVERILEASLGRAGALDGLRHGRVGNVLCPTAAFSEFTERLLRPLEQEEIPLLGALALDGELEDELARVQEQGLDEGATLLLGGVSEDEGRETPPGGFFPGARGAILLPTVFTNVEEHMQLVRTGRPVPLLCLLRVDSEEAGDELAARLNASRFQ